MSLDQVDLPLNQLSECKQGVPVSRPLRSLQCLLDWKPWKDPSDIFTRAALPLRCSRHSSAWGSEEEKKDEARNPRRLLVCHDMKGGYVEDTWPQGINNSSIYRVTEWPCVDTFVYFSHSLVTIPPPSWTNACHLQGTKVLGTFITEWDKGAEISDEILSNEENAHLCARQLAKISAFHGFDGWLFNIENPIKADRIPLLVNLLRTLTAEMHSLNPDSLVLWYDSVTVEGDLKWQDRLNDLNRCFFDACDGIFTNYSWPEHSAAPRDSADVAGILRASDVFMGVDTWEVAGRSGKGFRSGEVVGIALKQGVSAALFAPAWVYETGQSPCFQEANDRLWLPIHRAVEEHGGLLGLERKGGDKESEMERSEGSGQWGGGPKGGFRAQLNLLPFFSSFDEGVGSGMWLGGCHVARGEWGNLSCQTALPPLPSLTGPMVDLPSTPGSPEASSAASAAVCSPSQGNRLTERRATVIHSFAFEGGSCLSIQRTRESGTRPQDSITEEHPWEDTPPQPLSLPIQLFTAYLPSPPQSPGNPLPLHVSFSILSPLRSSDLLLLLAFQRSDEAYPAASPLSLLALTPGSPDTLAPLGSSTGAQERAMEAIPGFPSSLECLSPVGGTHTLPEASTPPPPPLPASIGPCSPQGPSDSSPSETGMLPVGPTEGGGVADPECQRAQGRWIVRKYLVPPKPGFTLKGIHALPVWGTRSQAPVYHSTGLTQSMPGTPLAKDGAGVQGPGPVRTECLYLGHVRVAASSEEDCVNAKPAMCLGVSVPCWEADGGGFRLTVRIAWVFQGSGGEQHAAAAGALPALNKGVNEEDFTWADVHEALDTVAGGERDDPSQGALAAGEVVNDCVGGLQAVDLCIGCSFHRFDVWARFHVDTSAGTQDNSANEDTLPACGPVDGARGSLQWVGVSFCQGYHVERLSVPLGCNGVSFLVQPRMLCGARVPLEMCSCTKVLDAPK